MSDQEYKRELRDLFYDCALVGFKLSVLLAREYRLLWAERRT